MRFFLRTLRKEEVLLALKTKMSFIRPRKYIFRINLFLSVRASAVIAIAIESFPLLVAFLVELRREDNLLVGVALLVRAVRASGPCGHHIRLLSMRRLTKEGMLETLRRARSLVGIVDEEAFHEVEAALGETRFGKLGAERFRFTI